jgi:hypothetical protein
MEIAQLPVRESKVEALPFRRAILVTAEGLDVAREAAVLGRPFRSMALGVLGMQVVQHGIQLIRVGQDPEEGHHAVQVPVVEVQLVPAEHNPAAGACRRSSAMTAPRPCRAIFLGEVSNPNGLMRMETLNRRWFLL